MKVPAWVVDILERSVTAFLAVFVAVVSAAPAGRVSWLSAADQGLFALLVALLSSALLRAVKVRFTKSLVDLAWRALLQFGQSLLAVMLTSQATSALHFYWTYAFHIAIVATIGVVLKGLAGIANDRTVGASVVVTHLGNNPA